MVPVKEPSMIKSNVKREREIIRTESVFQYVCVYLSLSLSPCVGSQVVYINL